MLTRLQISAKNSNYVYLVITDDLFHYNLEWQYTIDHTTMATLDTMVIHTYFWIIRKILYDQINTVTFDSND